jgi:GPH family glycoside/pentoside/hexuronide:cation symporter
MLRTSVSPYFMKTYAGRPDLVVSFLMTFTLGLAAGSVTVAFLTRRLSRQASLALMLGVIAVSGLGLYLCGPHQILLMFALQAISGAAFGFIGTLTFAMYADTADYNAWKTGHRATAMTYSMIMFSKKVGAAGAAAFIGWALAHYAANLPAPPAILDNIRLLTGLAPAILALVGIGIIALYDLTPEKVVKLQAQLLGGLGRPESNPLP